MVRSAILSAGVALIEKLLWCLRRMMLPVCYNEPMLTPEQETARAIKASQLYGQPLPNELIKKTTPSFPWWPALIVAFWLPLPFLFGVATADSYTSMSFGNNADLGAASILVIVLLMATLGMSVAAISYFRRTLYQHYLGTRVSYTLGMLGVAAVTYGGYMLTHQAVSQTSSILLEHILELAVLVLPISFIWTMVVVFVCDRLARR